MGYIFLIFFYKKFFYAVLVKLITMIVAKRFILFYFTGLKFTNLIVYDIRNVKYTYFLINVHVLFLLLQEK